jgi:hypothetical protein
MFVTRNFLCMPTGLSVTVFWLRMCLVHADSIQLAGIKWESGVLHMRGLHIERLSDLALRSSFSTV